MLGQLRHIFVGKFIKLYYQVRVFGFIKNVCDAPDSIIHANVYDQDEELTGRYHNRTLKINKSYKHHNTSQGPRRFEYKSSIIDESAEATISEYRHKLNKFALRRLAQTGIQIERGAGLLPGILLNYSWSSSTGST